MGNITERLISIAPDEIAMVIAELLDDRTMALNQGRLVLKKEGIFVRCNEELMPIELKSSIAIPDLCALTATHIAKQMCNACTEKRFTCIQKIQDLYEISIISDAKILLKDLWYWLRK